MYEAISLGGGGLVGVSTPPPPWDDSSYAYDDIYSNQGLFIGHMAKCIHAYTYMKLNIGYDVDKKFGFVFQPPAERVQGLKCEARSLLTYN